MHALRTERYKYIRYYGIWDSDEPYDIEADPQERHNLIREPAQGKRVAKQAPFPKWYYDEMVPVTE